MSGGSYDYLCYKDALQLLDYEGPLSAMANRLTGLGYAQEAAQETSELLSIVQRTLKDIQIRAGHLRNVWQAVEWWDSGDWDEDGVKQALAEYRKKAEERRVP